MIFCTPVVFVCIMRVSLVKARAFVCSKIAFNAHTKVHCLLHKSLPCTCRHISTSKHVHAHSILCFFLLVSVPRKQLSYCVSSQFSAIPCAVVSCDISNLWPLVVASALKRAAQLATCFVARIRAKIKILCVLRVRVYHGRHCVKFNIN